MKRLLVLLSVLCLLLTGCGQTQQETAVTPQEELPEIQQEDLQQSVIDTNQVIEMFCKTADSDCTVQDCVLVNDGAYGLVGVVQYARQDNFTHFAFVQADGLWHTAGIEAVPSGEAPLEYLGNGTVGLILFDTEKGTSFYFRLEYSNDGKGNVHFSASDEAVE